MLTRPWLLLFDVSTPYAVTCFTSLSFTWFTHIRQVNGYLILMFLLVFGSMQELEDVINDIYGSQGTICCKYTFLMKLVSYVTTIGIAFFVLAECSNDMALIHRIAIELPSDLDGTSC
jgi:hypothetical protein